jgi:PKHD-type hydroxylase
MSRVTLRPHITHNITYPWVYWDGFFSEEELVKIEEYCTTKEVSTGTVVAVEGGGDTDLTVRNSNVAMFNAGPDNQWLFEKLVGLTEVVNANFFNFDLLGFDYFQYTEYDGKGTKYDRHMDMIMGDKIPVEMYTPRKLSFSLILSDPSEFTGGEFEFDQGGKAVEKAEQKRGRVLAFPSYIIHGVKPVKKGKRRSIVWWCLGPKFK